MFSVPLRHGAALIVFLAVCAPTQARLAVQPRLPAPPTYAIVDLSGSDRELGTFMAETIYTEMLQDPGVRAIGPGPVRRAAASLKLQPTVLDDPAAAKRLAKRLGVRYLIVGSCLMRTDQVALAARVVDGATGAVLPGKAATAAGPRAEVMDVVHGLCARLLHGAPARVERPLSPAAVARTVEEPLPAGTPHEKPPATVRPGREPLPGAEPEPWPDARPDARAEARPETRPDVRPDVQPEPRRETAPEPKPDDGLGALRSAGLLPRGVRADGPVTERQLAALADSLSGRLHKPMAAPIEITRPIAPASRLKVLASLVKLAAPADAIVENRDAPLQDGPPDRDSVPAWGRPFVACALEEGWWDAGQPLKPGDSATWGFTAALLERTALLDASPASPSSPSSSSEPPGAAERYTGLIIDARDFVVTRTPNLRIFDVDGVVLYPDPKRLPNIDYLQQHGLASYCEEESEAGRAGKHPLVVLAEAVRGPGGEDMVVSAEDAEKIRQADRDGKLFARWGVVILCRTIHASEGR